MPSSPRMRDYASGFLQYERARIDRVSTFSDYYKGLLQREGVPFQTLVSPWGSALVLSLQRDFQDAVAGVCLKGSKCSIRQGEHESVHRKPN